jgi:16S rRNA (guanine(966)-N(2))-methyltransferase RsmD
MRIISGIYSGRTLQSKVPDGTRPTTDMAREALFNALHHLIDFEGITMLDLYAGTGAIGIEALSRGAGLVQFVESGFKQYSIIKENVNSLGIESSKYKIIKMRTLDYLKKYSGEMQFDMIFADPPYAINEYNDILFIVLQKNMLKDDGILIFEMEKGKNIIIPQEYVLIKEKSYGISKYIYIKLNKTNKSDFGK